MTDKANNLNNNYRTSEIHIEVRWIKMILEITYLGK